MNDIDIIKKADIKKENEPLTEKTLESKTIFSGRIIELKVDTIELENGKKATREYVCHNGGVCVLAIDDNQNCIFVKQFRYPYQKQVLEIPAGKRELNEEPIKCAARELEEETGYIADNLEFLGEMYPSPGYVGEIIYIYMATKLEKNVQKLDEDEFLSVLKIPLLDALKMVDTNEIKDAKTIVALLKMAKKMKIE